MIRLVGYKIITFLSTLKLISAKYNEKEKYLNKKSRQTTNKSYNVYIHIILIPKHAYCDSLHLHHKNVDICVTNKTEKLQLHTVKFTMKKAFHYQIHLVVSIGLSERFSDKLALIPEKSSYITNVCLS